MSKKQAAAVVAVMSCLIAGCGISASPADLVRSPKMEMKQQQVNQAISTYLPTGANMVVPQRPDRVSVVNEVDFDGDGQNEVVVFYKEEHNDYEINTLILNKSANGWEKLAELKGLAQDIDYFAAVDLTGDKRPELIIGYSGGEELDRELDVYTVANQRLNELWKQSYKAMAVGDMTGDKIADIAILQHDHNKVVSTTELYGFQGNRAHKLAGLNTDGAINGYDQVIIGPASAKQNGLFIDASMGAHSGYTALLIWENGKLQSVLKKEEDETALTFKVHPLSSKDANGDGIIEIGIQREPAGSENMAIVEIPYINGWYQWNGKAGIKLVGESFADYGEGFEFTIPDKWLGSYTVQREQGMKEGSVSFLYLGVFPQKKAKLLSLSLYKRSDWPEAEQQLKREGVAYSILSQNKNKLIVAKLPADTPELGVQHQTEFDQMRLTLSEVKQRFHTF